MFAVSSPYGKHAARLRQATGRLAAAAWLAGLAGCGSKGPFGPAVDFYHGLEGGAIAQQRPPPPGADDSYPNLGAIPPRPAAPDVAAQQTIADRLAAQRDAAEADAARTPLAAAPPRPATAAKLPATQADPNANRVVLDAAAASPAPAAQAPAGPAAPDLSAVPAVPAAVASGPVPSLAAAAPALPEGLGANSPPVAPAVPAPASVPDAPKPPTNTVLVAFTPGSATLPPSAPLNLRRFALAHKGIPVTVTGHGEAVLPGADPQSRALDLALRRAQAIAASLAAAGIPASNVRMRAEAAGQGGSVTL